MLMLLLLVLLFLPGLFLLTGMFLSAPRYRGPRSAHFDGRRFINPAGARAHGGLTALRWMLQRRPVPWKHTPGETYGQRPLGHFHGGIRVTFVNHSTFLIQVDRVNILIDPVWSNRVSPFTWAGPKRTKSPGIRFEDLPRIHLVLLSHNHYDHLDLPTLRLVSGAHHPSIITPLGVKQLLDREQIPGAQEADWWQELTHASIRIQLVPAQHFSGRGMLDRDATLWCGFVIKTGSGNIYFAGDTGYNSETFKAIGETCGPIRLSLLPIGAYKPVWFMSPIHTTPEEAVRIHLDVGSAVSIATHFGTFPLADEGQEEPITDLTEALQRHQVPPDAFITMNEGEVRVFE